MLEVKHLKRNETVYRKYWISMLSFWRPMLDGRREMEKKKETPSSFCLVSNTIYFFLFDIIFNSRIFYFSVKISPNISLRKLCDEIL